MTASSSVSPSYAGSEINLTEKVEPGKHGDTSVVIPDRDKPPPTRRKMMSWSWKASKPEAAPASSTGPTGGHDEKDEENGPLRKPPRPIRLFAPFYGGLGAALAVCKLSLIPFGCKGVYLIVAFGFISLHCQRLESYAPGV
jgi:hypothetical protein